MAPDKIEVVLRRPTNEQMNDFGTSEMPLLAFLFAKGYKPSRLIADPIRSKLFFFLTPTLKDDILNFYSGKALIEPAIFYRAFRTIRHMIEEGKIHEK